MAINYYKKLSNNSAKLLFDPNSNKSPLTEMETPKLKQAVLVPAESLRGYVSYTMFDNRSRTFAVVVYPYNPPRPRFP